MTDEAICRCRSELLGREHRGSDPAGVVGLAVATLPLPCHARVHSRRVPAVVAHDPSLHQPTNTCQQWWHQRATRFISLGTALLAANVSSCHWPFPCNPCARNSPQSEKRKDLVTRICSEIWHEKIESCWCCGSENIHDDILTSASKALKNFSMSKIDMEHMGQVNLQARIALSKQDKQDHTKGMDSLWG
jgi:hypothetical protein